MELGRAGFKRVGILFDGLERNLVLRSVLEGNTRGRIFVDSIPDPRASVVWNTLDTILIGCDHDYIPMDDISLLLTNTLIPYLKGINVPVINVYSHNRPVILKDLRIAFSTVEIERNMYEFNNLIHSNSPDISTHIFPIGENFFNNKNWGNHREFIGWINSFWPSVDTFLERSLGYCAIEGNDIASWCLGVYLGGNDLELGVATASEYRRKGLATATAAACINSCIATGLNPKWQCDAENSGSVALAERLGFRKSLSYFVTRI